MTGRYRLGFGVPSCGPIMSYLLCLLAFLLAFLLSLTWNILKIFGPVIILNGRGGLKPRLIDRIALGFGNPLIGHHLLPLAIRSPIYIIPYNVPANQFLALVERHRFGAWVGLSG